MKRFKFTVFSLFAILYAGLVGAEPVRVKHVEGSLRGFTVLSTLDGKRVADGDASQVVNGNRVTQHVIFRFKDGSVHEEKTVFSQAPVFKVISYHFVQKGATFPQALDMFIDAVRGNVTVKYSEKGEEQVIKEDMEIPADLANGMVSTLLKNIQPEIPQTWSYIAATPKPMLMHLKVSKAGLDKFSLGNQHLQAMHFVVKVDIGGITGILAKVFGKQPPDSHIWIIGGKAPGFTKSEQQLFRDGPIWRVEMTSPHWQNVATPK